VVLLENSVIGVEGAFRYTDMEAGVVDHGVAGCSPLFPGDRESVVDVVAAGFAISPSFDVSAWSVFTSRDFGSRFRVDDDADLIASQSCRS
jgi:hypothetical protein